MPFYHVWFTTKHDQPFLAGAAAARAQAAMSQEAERAHYEIHAASVSASHAHLVLHLSADADLDTAVRRLQQAGVRDIVASGIPEVWAEQYHHHRVPLNDLARIVRQVSNVGEQHAH